MRLYKLLVRFFRVFGQLYFAGVHTSGRRSVPATGPVLIAANHPSSILDAILLSTQTRRPIHYLGSSDLFRWPLLGSLYRQLGAIPVYRASAEHRSDPRNVEVFEQVFRLFERGGCVGIFPEGRNSPHAQVRELRTGAARMALGAEARNDYSLGLVIVPVGITFESRDFLLSTVLLRFGAAIAASDYAEEHRRDPEAAVRRLTGDLQQALRRQALHIDDLRLAELVADLANLLESEQVSASSSAAPEIAAANPLRSLLRRGLRTVAGWYRRTSMRRRRRVAHRVHDRQAINAVLQRALEEDPAAIDALRMRLERYRDHLYQTRLHDTLTTSFDQPARQRLPRLRMTLYAVAMAPIALFGLVHNGVPYAVTLLASRPIRDEATRAFACFAIGLVAFAGTYAWIGYLLWQTTHAAWTLLYLLALPPTGLAALGYRRALLVYRDRILVRTFLWGRRELAELLRQERQDILEEFRALAERFRPAS